MCRLALFNKKGFNLIEKKYGAEKFFTRLEIECGGHGNGIALLKNGKISFMHKSLEYSSAKIARQLRRMDWDWCVFHTRVKSVGAVNDKNCHPYRIGNTVLAMNGTETTYSGLANELEVTDTNAILLCVKKFNLDLFKTIKDLSSNFIGFENGVPFATSPNSWKSYEIAKDDDGAIIISSSLPSDFEKFEPVKKPFMWKEGEVLNVKKKVESKFVSTYYGHNSVFKSEKKTEKANVVTGRAAWEKSLYETRKRKDNSDYCCPDCMEIFSGSEIIEDMGDMYCPMCGETIRAKDRIVD